MQIAYHAIASHMLASEYGEAAVVDTTGSFSPLRLRDVLVFRLEAQLQRDSLRQTGYMYESMHSNNNDQRSQIIAQATAMLDRVKVMRVFDFAGLVEAIGEIQQMRENHLRDLQNQREAKACTRKEVIDSEDELDDDDDDNDAARMDSEIHSEAKNDGAIGMILVDTMTNVVSAVVSKSQVQGQALLANFMRSLYHLTDHDNICTILINAVVNVSTTKTSEYRRRVEDNVSIFSSTIGRPAMGKSFTYLIDASILVSTIPKTSKDASIAHGNDTELPYGKAFTIEVIKDRCGSREGKWAAFEIETGLKLVPCPG